MIYMRLESRGLEGGALVAARRVLVVVLLVIVLNVRGDLGLTLIVVVPHASFKIRVSNLIVLIKAKFGLSRYTLW